MVFELIIAGVYKQLRANSLTISQTANGRTTASFELLSQDRSYRPAQDAEVIMTEDGTRIFGGLIDQPSERGMFGGSHPGIITPISAVDFNVYPERRYISGTFPGGSLADFADWIVDGWLDVFGVSVHGSQVTGPAIPELTFDYVRGDAVLNQVATLTADAGQPFVWRIDNFKVFRYYQPSTVTAPFDLIGNVLPEVIGDVVVEGSGDYYNQVIVKVAPKTESGRTESWTYGTDTYPFQLQYTPTKHYGHVLLSTGGGETLGIAPDSPIQWEYDPATNTIERIEGTPATGTTYSMYFDGVFSGTWTATDASHATNPKELLIQVESVSSDTTGQAIADAELAKHLSGPRTVRYKTHEQGILPGQQQTINVSARNVNETAVITDVVIRDRVDRLERFVTAVVDDAQTNLDRGWRDVYRVWAGDKTGGTASVSIGAAGPVSVGPAPPFTSVQFNRSGSFGGDAAFTYDEDTNSLICGDDSAITAAAFSHCLIVGPYCEIADPS